MNDRERFLAVMNYGKFDRGIIQDFQYWAETLDVWHKYGLPKSVGWNECPAFFGFDRFYDNVGGNMLLEPAFEAKVLKDEGDTILEQGGDGIITRRHKYMSSIPQHVGHTLVDRKTWEEHYKPRLDPSHPDRFPKDLEARLKANADSVRTWPLHTWIGGFFGNLRNWMGLEGVSYIQYDDPNLFAEMIATIGECCFGTLARLLPVAAKCGVTFDYGSMWEDMSYAQGPLLGVPLFKQHCVPQYKRLSNLLREHGCNLIMLDSDGDSRLLLPHWLAAGVNIAFPLEIGTWGMDPIQVRKDFGRDLRICGGFDKHILAKGPKEIAAEIDRLAPMVEEGGFVPFCDHRVPPDVSLSNYLFYINHARKVWGRGLSDLNPMGKVDTAAEMYGKPYDFRAVLGEGFVPQH